MHKGVILLTKAKDREEAKGNVEGFLEGYGEGNVWDWYVMGGRWSGTFNGKSKEFEEKIKKLYPAKSEFGYSVGEIEEKKEDFQKLWEKIGGEEMNPFSRDSYNGIYKDDVMLAEKCENILKEWGQDMEEVAEKYWKKTVKARRDKKDKYFMSGYYAKIYARCSGDEFSFESNVYDIEKYTNKLPKDLKSYYAVIVDMHN